MYKTTIIPAQPGFQIVSKFKNKNTDGFNIEITGLVVGWKAEIYGQDEDGNAEDEWSFVTPVGCFGVADRYAVGVLRPDGKVETYDEGVFESIEAYTEKYNEKGESDGRTS